MCRTVQPCLCFPVITVTKPDVCSLTAVPLSAVIKAHSAFNYIVKMYRSYCRKVPFCNSSLSMLQLLLYFSSFCIYFFKLIYIFSTKLLRNIFCFVIIVQENVSVDRQNDRFLHIKTKSMKKSYKFLLFQTYFQKSILLPCMYTDSA